MLFLIPIAIGAILAGCDTEPEPEMVCRPANNPPPPPPTPDEYKLSDGHYSVIADKVLSPKVAQFYLDKLPVVSQEILNLFDISSPFKNGATIYLVKKTSKNNFCGNNKGCTGGGMVEFPFSTTAALEVSVQFNIPTIPLIHEMSHHIRQNTASPSVQLEEGLAVYTEVALIRSGSPAMQNPPAKLIYNGPIKIGDIIPTPSAFFTTYIKLGESTSPEKLVVIINEKEIGESYLAEQLIIGVPYTPIPGLMLIVSGNVASGLSLTLYQRPTFMSGELFAYLDVTADYVCEEKGYRQINTLRTDHDPVTLSETYTAYSTTHALNVFKSEDYFTNFCFWDTIRAKYGHAAVKQIVQKMSEYSKQHQAVPAPFEFYNTVKQITGMSDSEAKVLFAMVGAPTDSKHYMLGGVCW